MNELNKIDCRTLSFSPNLSSNRLKKAKSIFGENVLKRIIVFSLYILGVRRSEISRATKLPENTVRTMLKTILKDGFVAFFDRRKKQADIPGKRKDEPIQEKAIKIHEHHDTYQISISGTDMYISKKNTYQFKALIVTFAENGLISKTYAGTLLNISSSHVGYLIKNMSENDLIGLIDKRRGQQKDFVFTPEIKSELIVQFAVNAATGNSTSSLVLTKDLEQRTSYKLSPRSIRHHINNLGLKGKAKQLWKLISLKKNG